MKTVKLLALVVGMLATSAVLAENKLDVNGDFLLKNKPPTGWGMNKPAHWDSSGEMSLTRIKELDKNAIKLISQTKGMHLYCGKRFPTISGDKLILKAMVRGKGSGILGAYTYPGGGSRQKNIKASEEWTEFVAELSFPEEVKEICVVIGVSPGSSVEFLGLTAEIIKKK
ncbi:MAG: hypothetical protein PHS31_05390 [Victivallaceae bacterium]|nr:hypothetical protein [Victivallaceae bacterium]